MKKVSSVNIRLHELLTYYGIKQIDVARKTKLDKSMLNMYFSGKRIPKSQNLSIISRAYGVDISWLMGYDVPMFSVESVKSDMFYEHVSSLNDKKVRHLIECYEKCNKKEREQLLMYAQYICDMATKKEGQ